MKKLLALLAFLSALPVLGQYNPPPLTPPSGASLPPICSFASLFGLTAAGGGPSLEYCSAPNTWSVLGTGGGSGTVTSFSAGTLAPLFTTSVATATSTPALTFLLSNAAQNSVFAGPASGGAGAPSYQTAPTISAANMTNFPTFNQNTTGQAGSVAGTVNGNTYPASAGFTSGGIPYFSSTSVMGSSVLLTANVLVKGGGAGTAPSNSLITDNATTATYTGTGGYVAPVFQGSGTTAGFIDFPQGTTSAAVAPCNTATSICFQAPTAVTSQLRVFAGAPATGFSLYTNSSGTMTETITGAQGEVSAGTGLFGNTTYPINTVIAQTIAVYAGHFTNLVATSAVGGSCTTKPVFNVFDGTSNTGTSLTATATTQTKGTTTNQTQTLTFAAGDLIGIYISTAGATCTTDLWAVIAQYSEP